MQRSISSVFASTAKRFFQRNLQGKGNPLARTAPLSFSFCSRGSCGLERPFDDYREIYRNGLGRDIKPDDAIGLFGEMVKSRPFPSIFEFNKLLSAIVLMKKYDVVISLGEKMQMLGIRHDLFTYSILITCFCHCSQVSHALVILGKMMKLGYEYDPDVVSFSTLLSAYYHCNRISDEVSLVDKIVDQMVEKGYKPDTFTFNTLINELFLHGKVSEAVTLVDLMEKGFPPYFVTHAVVLNVCKRGDIDLALSLLKKVEEGQMKQNVVIYNTVLAGLCRHKRVNDALDLFNEMEKKGFKAYADSFSSLISCLCNHGRGSDAFRLLSDMIERNINPDVISFNALIDVFVKEKKLLEAEKLYKEMVSRSIDPNHMTYYSLINGYIMQGRLDEAKQMLELMVSKGCIPDVDTYCILTKEICQSKWEEESIELLEKEIY